MHRSANSTSRYQRMNEIQIRNCSNLMLHYVENVFR